MKKRNLRWLWMLLCLSMLLPLFSGWTYASQTEEDIFVNSDGYTLADVLAGKLSLEELYGPLNPEDVPEAVGYEAAVEKNHLRRRRDLEETLSHVVFENKDGTLSAYYFDYPVKYTDDSGNVLDISLEIGPSQNDSSLYGSLHNSSVVTTFGALNTDGIGLTDGEVQLSLVPILPLPGISLWQMDTFGNAATSITSEVQQLDDRTVSYPYDEYTSIEYSLTYTGFKEDIVVEQYTGQTEYSFRFLTNGLTLVKNEGSYYLEDNQGNRRGTLGDIIVFTADEQNNTLGSMTHVTVRANEEYLLTIHVDPQWLQDERTVYPIRIDPMVEIVGSAGGIADVTINSNAGSDGSATSLLVGNRETYGKARVLMKFPGVNMNTFATAGSIQSATVKIRDLMCESDVVNIRCYTFRGNTWSEATATWANTNPDAPVGTLLSSCNVSYANGSALSDPHYYSFDITKAFVNWKLGIHDPEKGIIFKAETVESKNQYKVKTFASYNRSSNKPSLSVTYENTNLIPQEGTYYLNNKSSGRYLKADTANGSVTTGTGTVNQIGTSIQWQLKYANGGYAVRLNSDTTKYMCIPEEAMADDYSVELITMPSWGVENNHLWYITIAPEGGVLLRNKYSANYLMANGSTVQTTYSSSTANGQIVWRLALVSSYQELSGFEVEDVIVNKDQDVALVITPSSESTYWNGNQDFTISYQSGTVGCIGFNSATFLITGKKVGIATYRATHKLTGRTVDFQIFVDRYTYVLTDEFGFSSANALLIREVYERVEALDADIISQQRAWISTRLLGGIVYDEGLIGVGFDTLIGDLPHRYTQQDYFCSLLGFSNEEYEDIILAVDENHSQAYIRGVSDFAHNQIAIAGRLSYDINEGILNWYDQYDYILPEERGYICGWLGDCVLDLDGVGYTVMKDDDYRADLDAENIYQRISLNQSIVNAANVYYGSLTEDYTRADEFLSHISIDSVQNRIVTFYSLYKNINNVIDMNTLSLMSLDEIIAESPDVAVFLQALANGQATL